MLLLRLVIIFDASQVVAYIYCYLWIVVDLCGNVNKYEQIAITINKYETKRTNINENKPFSECLSGPGRPRTL